MKLSREMLTPLKLKLIIKELHMVATSSRVGKGCLVFESLMDYKARFDIKYESYVAQENPEKDEAD